MANLMDVTSPLLELAEFMERFSRQKGFVHQTRGKNLKDIAVQMGVPVPEILKSAKVTLEDHDDKMAPGPAVRIYLGSEHKHPRKGVDVKKRCIRICIWWGVCFQVCWVCEDDFDRGCYLDIRRAN